MFFGQFQPPASLYTCFTSLGRPSCLHVWMLHPNSPMKILVRQELHCLSTIDRIHILQHSSLPSFIPREHMLPILTL